MAGWVEFDGKKGTSRIDLLCTLMAIGSSALLMACFALTIWAIS